jgi:hypothetical protein
MLLLGKDGESRMITCEQFDLLYHPHITVQIYFEQESLSLVQKNMSQCFPKIW